ncbi:zinc finger protein CONSTANS-LIKE 16 [Nicotiana tabacum]|uniref:Zinc finger protein CONSTANS-LIKE 16 n=2 Tax=Nicotiana TaxID=4085 RepID=A0A1S4C1B7_TOBAC|nr:PREDICTED: zinc finger protein CONSTANS-LIKE 16-like [Nicotiana sylvestris]XP_016494942.1 PREDICTED: zinc finger protein CONSTANS-LIKE 16-like [Nicotiana tabacum]
MTSSEKKLANVVGAKTARACDSCIRKRARWYCAADDAFLCQTCDSSVHSANPLARRHERVRLKTASLKSSDSENSASVPSWHRGFTRKARTPRIGKNSGSIKNPIQLIVPEISSDENSQDENEEQLLYRVPIPDPFVADEYSKDQMKSDFNDDHMNKFHGMLNIPSEMELAEFAADVESLLGKGLDDEESFNYMELGLGFLEKHDDSMGCFLVDEKIKVENEGEMEVVMDNTNYNQVDYSDTFDLKFDCDSPVITLEEDDKGEAGEIIMQDSTNDGLIGDSKNNKILLNLDYGGVLNAWADQRSPWTTGERPQVDSNDCWPVCMGNCGQIHAYGDMEIMTGHGPMIDEGREARVLRYKEKRRTRLFSKKIRYEVRKLNAEMRPRMKGRFVKRTNFAPTPFPSLNR